MIPYEKSQTDRSRQIQSGKLISIFKSKQINQLTGIQSKWTQSILRQIRTRNHTETHKTDPKTAPGESEIKMDLIKQGR